MAPHDPKMVAALRVERAGYARRGMDDRVAEVDEQLAYYGAGPEEEAPAGRTADPGLQTADASAPAGTASAAADAGDGSGPPAADTAAAAAADTSTASSTPAKAPRGRGSKAIPDASKG
jgi:hypothetical protein